MANHELAGIYRELINDSEIGEQLKYKIFFVVHCTKAKGSLVEKLEGGRNKWMTIDVARS